jgi:ADP-ribose pyrophosphatase YjhB (NUDIX family)
MSHLSQMDTYFVAVKLFLEKDGKLFIFKDRFGVWDLPGGRIRKDEFATPIEEIIKRKVKEELGDEVEYELGAPVVTMRVERQEASPEKPTIHIFAVGYRATMTGGTIKLSSQHTEMLWVDPKDFKPEDYFSGGWLKGAQDYIALS